MRISDWSSDVCSSDLMRISALMLALGSAAAAHAAPPHYDVAAKFDPQGVLDADVTITLSEGEAEKAFLLSDRFALRPMDLPPGVTMSVEPSPSPMPALNEYSFRFSALSADPVTLRFRYSGPLLTPHDNNGRRSCRGQIVKYVYVVVVRFP